MDVMRLADDFLEPITGKTMGDIFRELEGGCTIQRIEIPGKPVPKARPRMTKTGHTYTPKRTAEAEAKIREAWVYEATDHPVEMELLFGMEIPKSWPKSRRDNPGVPTKRPDIDNLIKTVLDALNGVAYLDDSQVVSIRAAKCYAEEPYTMITVIVQD